jgi:hypothetical protein
MILRPTHSRVVMAAAITGRDSTARYSAMRGPTAAWRAMVRRGIENANETDRYSWYASVLFTF